MIPPSLIPDISNLYHLSLSLCVYIHIYIYMTNITMYMYTYIFLSGWLEVYQFYCDFPFLWNLKKIKNRENKLFFNPQQAN